MRWTYVLHELSLDVRPVPPTLDPLQEELYLARTSGAEEGSRQVSGVGVGANLEVLDPGGDECQLVATVDLAYDCWGDG